MSQPGAGGPVLLVGGSDALGESLDAALVEDGWNVVRPIALGATGASLPSDTDLEAFWSAPTPPSALVVAAGLDTPTVPLATTLERWIARLDPRGCAVLVREPARLPEFEERLARSALADLTAELARRLAPHRRVNAVYGSPPPADLNTLPLRRPGAAGDLAAAATFLAGPASTFMTGVVVLVDGGAHLRWPLADA